MTNREQFECALDWTELAWSTRESEAIRRAAHARVLALFDSQQTEIDRLKAETRIVTWESEEELAAEILVMPAVAGLCLRDRRAAAIGAARVARSRAWKPDVEAAAVRLAEVEELDYQFKDQPERVRQTLLDDARAILKAAGVEVDDAR